MADLVAIDTILISLHARRPSATGKGKIKKGNLGVVLATARMFVAYGRHIRSCPSSK